MHGATIRFMGNTEVTLWWTLDKTELLPNIYTYSSLFAGVRYQDRGEKGISANY